METNDGGTDNEQQLLLEKFVAEGTVQLGQFMLKGGQLSPIYVDFRVLVSVPEIMKEAARCLCAAIENAQLEFDCVVGVPFGAIMLATLVSTSLDKPMLLKRKEAKTYGKRKLIEGRFEPGQSALIIEDVVTSGASVLETVADLRAVGLRCVHVFCVLDREQGGEQQLLREGILLNSLLRMGSLLNFLERRGIVDADKKAQIIDQLQNPIYATSSQKQQEEKKSTTSSLPLSSSTVPITSVEWAQQFAEGTLNRRLAHIMVTKQTNVCLAVDCTHCGDILKVITAAKEHICAVKLHHDIVVDFDAAFGAKLHKLAVDHQFLIVEDRKFADTGKTMELQLIGGALPIADWADLVTAHALPGMASIAALKPIVTSPSRRLSGILLIAQLSTDGALTDDAYAAKCAQIGRDCGDQLVAGFICQQRWDGGGNMAKTDQHQQQHNQRQYQQFLHWTPGVNLSGATGDGLGQRWRSPADAVGRDACDIVVVGRGITGAADISAEARRYARVAWDALCAARAWTTDG